MEQDNGRAWQFNRHTGEYIPNPHAEDGSIKLQASPEEPGVFFDRPDATRKPVLLPESDKARLWNGKDWYYVADFRGRWWDKKNKVMYIIEEVDIYPNQEWTRHDPFAKGISPHAVFDEAQDCWVWNAEAEAKADQEAVNREARAYLASTDWYVIRQQETGKAVPADVLAAREAARERVVET